MLGIREKHLKHIWHAYILSIKVPGSSLKAFSEKHYLKAITKWQKPPIKWEKEN